MRYFCVLVAFFLTAFAPSLAFSAPSLAQELDILDDLPYHDQIIIPSNGETFLQLAQMTSTSARAKFDQDLFGHTATPISTPKYFPISGVNESSAEERIQQVFRRTGVLKSLRCSTTPPPAPGVTWTFRVRKNATDTKLFCTHTTPATTCTPAAVAVAPGDLLNYAAERAGHPSETYISCAVQFTQ